MSETTSRSNGARREHVQTYCMDGVGQWSCYLFAVSVRPRKHTQVCNALWNSLTPTGNETEIIIIDHFYIALLSALEQTQSARM